MKSRIDQLHRGEIFYLPALRPYAKSVPGCLLMQALELKFEAAPEGFNYAFKPGVTQGHPKGESWEEFLGFDETTVLDAFRDIGEVYASEALFNAAVDVFKGKFYASYPAPASGLTRYVRNHESVEHALQELARSEAAAGGQEGVK